MARITVEDCLKNVNNRFELVLIASKRARQLAQGKDPLVPANHDKPTIIALREIAANLVNSSILESNQTTPQLSIADIGEISKEITAETQSITEDLEILENANIDAEE